MVDNNVKYKKLEQYELKLHVRNFDHEYLNKDNKGKWVEDQVGKMFDCDSIVSPFLLKGCPNLAPRVGYWSDIKNQLDSFGIAIYTYNPVSYVYKSDEIIRNTGINFRLLASLYKKIDNRGLIEFNESNHEKYPRFPPYGDSIINLKKNLLTDNIWVLPDKYLSILPNRVIYYDPYLCRFYFDVTENPMSTTEIETLHSFSVFSFLVKYKKYLYLIVINVEDGKSKKELSIRFLGDVYCRTKSLVNNVLQLDKSPGHIIRNQFIGTQELQLSDHSYRPSTIEHSKEMLCYPGSLAETLNCYYNKSRILYYFSRLPCALLVKGFEYVYDPLSKRYFNLEHINEFKNQDKLSIEVTESNCINFCVTYNTSDDEILPNECNDEDDFKNAFSSDDEINNEDQNRKATYAHIATGGDSMQPEFVGSNFSGPELKTYVLSPLSKNLRYFLVSTKRNEHNVYFDALRMLSDGLGNKKHKTKVVPINYDTLTRVILDKNRLRKEI